MLLEFGVTPYVEVAYPVRTKEIAEVIDICMCVHSISQCSSREAGPIGDM